MSKKNDVVGTEGKTFESKYDEKKLKKMIEEGKHADEIQEELGIVSKQSLRQHVLRLITTEQKFIEVKGLYSERAQRLPMINFKGELKLSKLMIKEGEFSHGDKFKIDEISNERIVMTRIGVTNESEKSDDPESAKK